MLLLQAYKLQAAGDWPMDFWKDVFGNVVKEGSTTFNAVVIGEEFSRGTINLVKRGVRVVSCLTRRHNLWVGKKGEAMVSTDMTETFAKSINKKKWEVLGMKMSS